MTVDNDILIPRFAQYLRENKEVLFTPSGVSMRPFIEGGKDSVVLQPLTRDPRVGDVLLANVRTPHGNTYVLHRLVRVTNGSNGPIYVLQGDGNLCGEETCARQDIIGRVTDITTPSGRHKRLTRGRVWYALKPLRKWLLKIYRHTMV